MPVATDLAGPFVGEPGSPRWWLDVLSRRLEERRPLIERWEAYYEGEHPLFFATPKFREAFGRLFQEFADNWCPVVVNAVAERIRLDGFRVGDDEGAHRELRDAFKRARIGTGSLATVEAVKSGEAYVIVEPVREGPPRITIEHPAQVIVAHDPGDRTRRLAALKRWMDDDGIVYSTVYLPDAAYRFRTKRPQVSIAARGAEWTERDDGPSRVGYGPLAGTVPVAPILNDPSLLHGGRSDLRSVVPLQDAINKLANDLLVASEFSAFRQRLLTGAELPRYPDGHPQAGEPMVEAFISGVSRLLVIEDEQARAQEFAASDLGVYVAAIEMFVAHLAAQTRTPPHYLMGRVVNASGDALKAAETGLVSKVRGKLDNAMSADWEDIARLVLRAMRSKAADAPIEAMWADPESRTLGEVVDAAVKLKALEVPLDALWERIGASSQERDRWDRLRQKQQAEVMALALAGTSPTDQGVPGELSAGPTAGDAATAGLPVGGESDAGAA